MARYIDAEKLAEYITTNYCKNCDIYDGEKCNACPMNDALNFIETFQTAEVVPKSEGKWKPYKDYFTHRQIGWICTNCSAVTHDLRNGDTDYCPHCGAVMETESEEEDE